jgi:hypothetical protein
MDINNHSIKLAVVYLGKYFGKTKFSLVDERDITLAVNYKFDLHVETQGNGSEEVKCYAITMSPEFIDSGGCYLHNMVWEKHRGIVSTGYQVYHKNGITLDNRLSNLQMLASSASNCPKSPPRSKMPSTLYWQAMVRLPPLKTDQENWELTTTVLSSNGEREEKTIVPLLYECQNTPCLAFEQHIDQFTACPECRTVKYCSMQCLQVRWCMQ